MQHSVLVSPDMDTIHRAVTCGPMATFDYNQIVIQHCSVNVTVNVR